MWNRLRGGSSGLVAVVCAAVIAAVVPGPMAYAADEEAPAASSSEGQKALDAARESGERVEVPGQRTERTTVFANPDGATFTLEESAVPVRVRASGGVAGRRRTRRW
ncbi:hypothetical protein ABVB25_08875 [Streptomyces anthocyanicus]|nr:hypothetical protein [Streptomyces anthocyanicus]